MAGFECEFVEKPPRSVQAECPICLLVFREPYQATCCGKSFCKECIHRIKASKKACPTCKDKDFTLFPNKGLQQSLYDFRVYCTHKSRGCEWTGELRELDNHLNSDPPADKALQGCPYAPIKCPLGCAGCEKGVYRKDVKAHVNDKLLGHVMMQNAQIASFKEQLEKVQEDKEVLKRRVTELETKVHELSVQNKKLDVQNTELEKKVEELHSKLPEVAPSDQPISKSKQSPVTFITGTYKPNGAEFTMTDFEEYKRDNEEWHSPHFYTHPNGYKMCLRIDANGIGAGKGTHLSVGMCLMRGEFDDQLKWPFRGEVTIKLVNQEEDKDHVTCVVSYAEASDRVCQRVTVGNRSKGKGFCDFLPHTELQPKYLKNDCIKLCIKKVEIF